MTMASHSKQCQVFQAIYGACKPEQIFKRSFVNDFKTECFSDSVEVRLETLTKMFLKILSNLPGRDLSS